jgi:lipase maturation factor 1
MDSSSFVLAQWLFLKCLAINYFLAFGSLYWQVLGLYGSRGIIPIVQILKNIESSRDGKPYLRVPTLFWLSSTDFSLRLLALLGMAAALLVLVGVVPAPLFFFMWLAYLSYLSVGSVFLSFQWDTLLLEVGFVAIFFSIQSPPPILFIPLLWLLLFRLIFSSGLVKILSGCPAWGSLTAMHYHYETQPIPNRLAYYFHQQSELMAKGSVLFTYFLELFVPFMIFTPSPFREAAFLLLLLLQLLIFFTGNYAFFNTLSITLCIPLLNNGDLSWLLGSPSMISSLSSSLVLEVLLDGVAAFLILLNVLELMSFFYPLGRLSRLLASPYHLVSGYGLFARMTTRRDEIIIEGSNDGQVWQSYEFKWKPGDTRRAPRQVAPYHPRLDWQMWFAALSSYHYQPWFVRFMMRLLEGSPEVLKLLASNPFAEKPPKYLRAQLYQYHFSDLKTKQATGDWWIRSYKGLYCPSFSLKGEKEEP